MFNSNSLLSNNHNSKIKNNNGKIHNNRHNRPHNIKQIFKNYVKSSLYVLLKFHEILMPCFKRKNSEDDFKTKIKWWLCFKKILYKLLGAHINLIIFIGICFSFFGFFFDEKENRNYWEIEQNTKKTRASTYVILLLLL